MKLACFLLMGLFGLLFPLTDPPLEKPQKVRFFLVGGKTTTQLKETFIELAGGIDANIVAIFAASDVPDTSRYYLAFNNHVRILPVYTRRDADDEDIVSAIDKATGVWFGGGDQNRLMNVCRGTLLEKKLRAFKGILGGTSAGASAMSKIMITGNTSAEGFGFLEQIIIDQHFTQRHRQQRLAALISKYSKYIGIGIDEETAAYINGDCMRVMGTGAVTIIDDTGRPSTYSNTDVALFKKSN